MASFPLLNGYAPCGAAEIECNRLATLFPGRRRARSGKLLPSAGRSCWGPANVGGSGRASKAKDTMPTLFDDQEPPALAGPAIDPAAPLPERMRPRTLDEIVGQEAVVGPSGFLRRAIESDRVPSLVFWGPPGSGKTTLARVIAAATSARFVPFSAVTSGIKEVKEVMAEAAEHRRRTGKRTLLFVDEIHRFNRAQQDAFLPYVERGDIVL